MENNIVLNPTEDIEYQESHLLEEEFLEDKLIDLDTSIVSECILDKEEFDNGIKKVSALCGAITALVNVGITPSKAMDYLVEKEAAESAMEHNLKMAEIQANAAIQSAKFDGVTAQKNMF